MPDDYPLSECAQEAQRHVARGATVYQKYTCSECGSRQTMEMPNVFYTSGRCEECDAITDIREQGCNYLLVV